MARCPACNPLLYLASPYAHENDAVREERFNKVTEAAGILISHGYLVYSPITHCRPIAKAVELPRGWEFWQKQDEAFLQCSWAIAVLCIPGWRSSVGVTAELKIARELEASIYYLHPNQVHLLRTYPPNDEIGEQL